MTHKSTSANFQNGTIFYLITCYKDAIHGHDVDTIIKCMDLEIIQLNQQVIKRTIMMNASAEQVKNMDKGIAACRLYRLNCKHSNPNGKTVSKCYSKDFQLNA